MLEVGSPKVEIAEGYWLEAENRKMEPEVTE